MRTAKSLKSQATQIKRSVTGIRNVIDYAKAQRRYHNVNLLSEADAKVLVKAVIILNKICAHTSGMATTVTAGCKLIQCAD